MKICAIRCGLLNDYINWRRRSYYKKISVTSKTIKMGNSCSNDDDEITPTQLLYTRDEKASPNEKSSHNEWRPNVSLNKECIICYEEIYVQNAYWLPCGHVYHDKCIRQWFAWTADRLNSQVSSQVNPQQRKIVYRCPICNHSVLWILWSEVITLLQIEV